MQFIDTTNNLKYELDSGTVYRLNDNWFFETGDADLRMISVREVRDLLEKDGLVLPGEGI